MQTPDIPPTRWQLSGDRNAGYAEKFTEMLDTGQDVDAEARLADVLAPRNARILGLSPELLASRGAPTEYDVITLVGNVVVLLAEGTEVHAFRLLRALLAPGGRMLVSYHLSGGPAVGRSYPFAEFEAEAQAAGLVVDQRFGSYELLPTGDRVVAVLSARP